MNDAGTFRPVFASFLSRWMDDGRDAVLDEIAQRFNGFRSFCGDLGWSGQTPASARAALPGLMTAAKERGLYVYACVNTGAGYDTEAHTRDVAAIVEASGNGLIDGWNEIGHASQSDIGKDPARALDLARRVIPVGVAWTLGAPVWTDEPTPEGTYPTDGGLFNDAHLDRGRDFWDQVRRVREIENISSVTRKPAMSGEPIGAAEASIPGKRESDPTFFYTLGLLCRGFEVGGVFHSEAGLQGQLLGPNQRRCADAYVAGGQAIPTNARLQFKNATWSDSPIKGADFSRVVRAYSFLAGAEGWLVLVGLTGDPQLELQNGWQLGDVVAERPGVQVRTLTR